ncbi:hypothetical protein F511_13946 [Dorcoceras hygrometricum]|uniref:Uncharacterized protein n=1 Tax=Dorcoceras hygrometricum TaxID=472368 RepID=A0A2Z7AXJ7_9LAMI|nr:hypothetical protein F511_13946 [Dorcoceras hygrometricum]
MTFRVVRTNQYNQDLGLIHSTNGNHLESPNEDSSIDHQVTIYLHAQNITMFPTNETCTKSWADTDSESTSSDSSSSDSEQEEVHCLMADHTDDDEVFDFANTEFTRDDLVTALNDMVKEYRKLSHSFEEAKAENISLKNSSTESSSDELEDVDSLKTELSKLTAENEVLKDDTSVLKAEIEALKHIVSSWNHATNKLDKLCESQKPDGDRTGLGFNSSNSSDEGPSTQSRPTYDKFNKMSFVKESVTHDSCESMSFDDQNSPKLNQDGKTGIGYSKPEGSKPSCLKNKLDKDKAKAGPKPFVPNQRWRNSKKVKSDWKNFQQRRGQYDQSVKSQFKKSPRDFAQIFVDPRTGKTMMTTIHFGLKINWSKVLFSVLKEMIDRSVKNAKGFGAQISVLLNSDPVLSMGIATPFPASKILCPKVVLTYISANETADARGQSEEGGKSPVAVVKRASKSKKKSEPSSDAPVEIVSEVVGSKKRPVSASVEPVITKKKRTSKSKPSSSQPSTASIAKGVIPLQVVAPPPIATVEKSPVRQRQSKRRTLILPTVSEDETEEEDFIRETILTTDKDFDSQVDEPVIPDKAVGSSPNVKEADNSQSMNIEGTVEQAGGSTRCKYRLFGEFLSASRGPSGSAFDSESSSGDTVYRSPSPPDYSYALGSPILSPTARDELLYTVELPVSPPPISREAPSSSSSDSDIHFDDADISLEDIATAQTTAPAAPADLSPILDDLKTSLSQCVDNAHHDTLSRLRSVEQGIHTLLGHQADYIKGLFQGVRQEGKNRDDIQMVKLNELTKSTMAQSIKNDASSLDTRNRFIAIDAKFRSLDGHIAAIRNDQLEFQTKIAADILGLSTQISEIADYIRSGNDKKGEVGSSSRPPPVLVERRPVPTPVVDQSGGDAGGSSGPRTTTIVERFDDEFYRRERERRGRGSRRRSRGGSRSTGYWFGEE